MSFEAVCVCGNVIAEGMKCEKIIIITLRIYDMNARMVDYGSKLLAIGDRNKMQIRNYVFVDRSELITTTLLPCDIEYFLTAKQKEQRRQQQQQQQKFMN